MDPINSRPCVCAFVYPAEISKSVHRNFFIFGTKLGLLNATEVTFSDFAKKIPFGRFWPILVKKWPFFGPPQRGWDLWFSLRPCVRSFVRKRSQNPFIGIF